MWTIWQRSWKALSSNVEISPFSPSFFFPASFFHELVLLDISHTHTTQHFYTYTPSLHALPHRLPLSTTQ